MSLSVSAEKSHVQTFSSSAKEEKDPPKKDLFDHMAQRAGQAEGAWDFFRVVCHATQYPGLFSGLKEPHKTNIKNISTAAELAGSALAFPALVKNVNDIRHHYRDLTEARSLPDSDNGKKKKVREALGAVAIDVANTMNSGTQGALFLNGSNLISLGKGYTATAGVYNATSILTDGWEGIQEAGKLKKHLQEVKNTKSPEEKQRIHQKIRLSSFVITKDVISVALSIIGILALCFAAAFQGFILLPIIVLGLSTVWLATKIISYFYEQMLKEQPPLQPRMIKA